MQDRLGVAPFIKRLIKPLLLTSPESSLVLGLYGPWGSGKSTALNFLGEALEKLESLHQSRQEPVPNPIVVRFSPWLYSNVEGLLGSFFETLATVVGDQPAEQDVRARRRAALKGLGEFIAPAAKLGAMVLSLPSGLSDRAIDAISDLLSGGAKAATAVMEGGEVTFRGRKDAASSVLRSLSSKPSPQRVVVLIDDLDRAGPDEIVAMLKVLKLVGDLPNVSYVVAMDVDRVAKILEGVDGSLRGEAFLEKFVQIGVHLPPFDDDRLSRFAVGGAIEIANRGGMASGSLMVDWNAWELIRRDSYERHIQNSMRTPRDVVRLLNAFTFATLSAEDRSDMHPVDLLLLCILQTKFPAVYAKVRANRRFLLNEDRHSEWSVRDDAETRKVIQSQRRQQFAEIAIERKEDADAVIRAAMEADTVPLIRRYSRGKGPAQLEVLYDLFPHCLSDHAGGEQDRARERLEARLCAPKHFDGYFRLDPAPGVFALAEIEALFTKLTSEVFDSSAAQTLARELESLDEKAAKSLRHGLQDRTASMTRDEAIALARVAQFLAGTALGTLREIAALLAVLSMDRLSSIYKPDDKKRDAVIDRNAGLEGLHSVIQSLPSEEAAELADDLSAKGSKGLQLTEHETRNLAVLGYDHAIKSLTQHPTAFGDSPHQFSHAIWRCTRLARRAGLASSQRFGPVEEFVRRLLESSPIRVADVVALGAAWTGDDFATPSLNLRSYTEITGDIDRIIDVNQVIELVHTIQRSGEIEFARSPDLLIEFMELVKEHQITVAQPRGSVASIDEE